MRSVTPMRPLKIIHTVKLIRILLSRREKKRGKIFSRRAAYGATSGAALLRLLKFRGWKRPPFLSLLDSCASPSAPEILSKNTRPSLHFFLPPLSVETLLTKRATIPRSIPPSVPELSFGVSERLPLRKTLAKHPCESFSRHRSLLREREQNIFSKGLHRNHSYSNAL